MAHHPPITPEELAKATAEYLRTGSYSDAARAIGRSINGTRDALRRHGDDAIRRKVYARALDGALAEAVDAQRVALRKLRPDLAKPKGRADAAFAINDTAKSLVAARTALAKLTGEHAPEKIQHDVRRMTDAELDAEIARLAGRAGAAGDDAPGAGAAEGSDPDE